MKLKISLVSLLLAFVTVTFAQEQGAKTYTETAGFRNAFKHNSAGSNWFIQLGAGGQMLIAEAFSDNGFQTSGITLDPTFAVGKWFSPWLALRLKGEGGSLHSFPSADLETAFMQKDRYYAAHIDLLWNMSNYWGKYNAKRVFSFIPYVGVGGYYREDSDQQLPPIGDFRSNGNLDGITLHGGLLFQFRLSNHVGFHIDLAGLFTDDQFNRIEAQRKHSLGRYEGVASATAGFTFNLGKTYFETVEGMDYGLINDLNNKINDLRSENELLSKRPLRCDPCPEVKPLPVTPTAAVENNFVSNVVLFRINSATVDANQQASIYNTAQFVKNSGEKIKVVGYADKQTGSSAYNLKISEQRAKAVAKELTSKYGIPSDKIVVEWKGANEQPYKETIWNRVVIMNAQ